MTLKVLDLFSGIGGFSLGLEKAGMETVAFCEIDPLARRVLKKHWTRVPVFKDVKNLKYYLGQDSEAMVLDDGDIVDVYAGKIDVICGGFPCQDISVAGKGKGLKGERSGLWTEFKRLIQEIKPRYAIVENVANLRGKGLAQVIQDLRQIGYDCEWHIISARSVGAPHLRERIWIIAYPNSTELRDGSKRAKKGRLNIQPERETESPDISKERRIDTSNSDDFRLWKPFATEKEKSEWWAKATASVSHWSKVEPPICGVDDGLPRGLDKARRERIKQLGNAVVPQIPEIIGRAIVEYENGVKQ